ncbi:22813_t:CDS:2 [Gigaspora rosea]|nr:22813_t:CDS:2 [Gigaspora rosea]
MDIKINCLCRHLVITHYIHLTENHSISQALEESKRELLVIKKLLFETEVQLTVEDQKIASISSSVTNSTSKPQALVKLPRGIAKKNKKLWTLVLYLKELDDRIENLIPSDLHEFLTNFFKQNLTDEEWQIKIDNLRCPDQNDSLMSHLNSFDDLANLILEINKNTALFDLAKMRDIYDDLIRKSSNSRKDLDEILKKDKKKDLNSLIATLGKGRCVW